MLTGQRERLYPDAAAEARLRSYLGSCRLIHNLAVEQRALAWKLFRVGVGYAEQCSDLAELRNDADAAPWLSAVPAQVLQQAVRDVDVAYRNFWEHGRGYPRFHSRHGTNSFRVPQGARVRRATRRRAEVLIPMAGWVSFPWTRALPGKVRNCTVTLEPDGTWWVGFQLQRRSRPVHPANESPRDASVGVDLGVAVSAALSNGEQHHIRGLTAKEAERLRRLERKRSRQQPGSKNRDKTTRSINKLHATERRRARGGVEQISARLAANHRLVAFEDLNVVNMTRSASGTAAEPGTNVAQKRGLNRAVQSQRWGAIRSRTEDKAARHNTHVIRAAPHHSSQECPACGNVDADARVTRDHYSCGACGYEGHSDVGAAAVTLRRCEAIVAERGGLDQLDADRGRREERRQPTRVEQEEEEN